jgi:NAD(P)-dependent dehydrogenase (short-subunit alcohol dehydrogenase family)
MAGILLVTGAGNGIGRAALTHFVDAGWRGIALDTDEEALDELAGDSVLAIPCDVGSEAAVKNAFERMGDWLGDRPINLLVNNAGIADPYCGPLENLSLASWNGWIDASLTAAFLVSRAAIPLLRRADAASIVNISSTRALMSEPETFAYAAAKGGLDALTHAMAISLGPQIRVNAVLPGWIETGPWQKQSDRSHPDHSAKARNQHPAGRVGTPLDIARTIEWLAGEGAGFVTGQQIVVDGGMTRRMIYES